MPHSCQLFFAYTDLILQAVVDAPYMHFKLKNRNPLTGEMGVGYEMLNDWLSKGAIITIGSSDGAHGLVRGHAYSVLSTHKVSLPDKMDPQEVIIFGDLLSLAHFQQRIPVSRCEKQEPPVNRRSL